MNDHMPAQSSATKGESVGDLLRAVRQEEAKVHIDLSASLKVCQHAIRFSLL